MHKSIAGALARSSSDDARLRDVARTLPTTATPPAAHTLSRLQTVPGIGTILHRVLRDAIHAINRFPTGQDVVSYGRLVPWAKESAGTRVGTAGTTSGTAHLTWAFAAAAGMCLRDPPPAQQVPRPVGEKT